jgi:hypothetical protein
MNCISFWHVGANTLISNRGRRGQSPSSSGATAHLVIGSVAQMQAGWSVLEPSTLDTRRFLFQLSQSLSGSLHRAPAD